jgi:hypothetical protein
MARLYADRADTQLAAGIDDTVTAIDVVDGSVFPAPTGGDFAILTIEEGVTFERVRLTARSGNTLTVVRGNDGTSALSFTAAATVSLRQTASAMAGVVEKTGDTMTGPLTITGGTVTASAPLIDATQTWNDSGTTFTGLRLNVTDTASAAASEVFSVQLNSASFFRILKNGRIFIPSTGGNFSFIVGGTNSISFGFASPGFEVIGGAAPFTLNAASGLLTIASNSAGLALGNDNLIIREGSNLIGQRVGTSPQTFRIYNTWSSSGTNHERARFSWVSNVFTLGTEKGGTGVARAMELQTDGTTALTLTTAQKAEFAQTIKTAAPSGGTAAEWKLGTVASVTPTSPDRTIEVEIGGTTYYLAAKTTND